MSAETWCPAEDTLNLPWHPCPYCLPPNKAVGAEGLVGFHDEVISTTAEGICRRLLMQWWHNPEGYNYGFSTALMLSMWALGGTLEKSQDVLDLIVLALVKG